MEVRVVPFTSVALTLMGAEARVHVSAFMFTVGRVLVVTRAPGQRSVTDTDTIHDATTSGKDVAFATGTPVGDVTPTNFAMNWGAGPGVTAEGGNTGVMGSVEGSSMELEYVYREYGAEAAE